jgi:ribosomal protein S18 acetylase RimI-like enzyme
VTATISLAPLQPSHRTQLEEIVRATGVFSAEEIAVALELFDAGVTADAGHGTWDMGRDPEPHVARAMSAVSQRDYEFVGAFEGEALIGYACFGATPATDRTYDLYWIAVHPNAQRSGAGAALMADVERQLAERRARLIVVETSSRDHYAPTRRFYRKRGYEEVARVRDFYSPGDDRVVLTKRLTADPSPASGALPFPISAYE